MFFFIISKCLIWIDFYSFLNVVDDLWKWIFLDKGCCCCFVKYLNTQHTHTPTNKFEAFLLKKNKPTKNYSTFKIQRFIFFLLKIQYFQVKNKNTTSNIWLEFLLTKIHKNNLIIDNNNNNEIGWMKNTPHHRCFVEMKI